MPESDVDPIIKRAVADGVLERASSELKKLMKELALALDPFPTFLETSSIQAVEVPPGGVADRDRGCIVVCPDGELYELVVRMVPGPIDAGGVDAIEEMKEAELSPGDYVAYAYVAVRELAAIVEDRER